MARTDTARRPTPRAGVVAPPWLIYSSLVISVLGLGIAGYLTYEHYTASSTLACSDTGVINCLKVTTSAQSKLFGIPVALLGLLFFAGMVPLCLPAAWNSPNPLLRRVRLAAVGIGILLVFYLVYAELFIIDSICLWCTAVHVLTLALFAVVAFGTATMDPIEAHG